MTLVFDHEGRRPSTRRQPARPARILESVAKDKPKVDAALVPSLTFVLFLPYRQVWTLQGFARGDHIKDIWLSA